MSCQPNAVSTLMDRIKTPAYLHGMVAPLAVWDHIDHLNRRIEKLERELEARSPSGKERGE